MQLDRADRGVRVDALMAMTATACRVGNSLKHEVDVNGRHTIVTDEPEQLGGTDAGPAPHELLAATLASCIATMIALYAQNRGWDIGETAVNVEYDPDSSPRRFAIAFTYPATSRRTSGADSSGSPRPARCVARWKPASPSRRQSPRGHLALSRSRPPPRCPRSSIQKVPSDRYPGRPVSDHPQRAGGHRGRCRRRGGQS